MTPEELLTQIGKHWGWEVGDKVRAEINSIIAANDVDIQQLQGAINTIQTLLDADPNTPEFDVGQNIITQLSDHLTRITGLESSMSKLNGDETQVGSVAYAVKQERDRAVAAEGTLQSGINANTASINTLNGDDTVDGSVAKKIKTAVDAEQTARSAADANLQSQIDNLSGGGTGSIAAIQTELDAIEAGAGLDADGSYSANTSTNYINTATSLKDADEKLDAAIKAVETANGNAQAKADANEAAINTLNGDATVDGSVAKQVATAKTEAVADAKTYADNTFVTKDAIANISAATLASIFRAALDCGFAGETKQDVLDGTANCAAAGGSTGGTGGSGDAGSI